MVLPFDANMVSRMKVKHHQLLPESYGGQELSQAVLGLWAQVIEDDGKGPVNQESHGNGWMLKVVEMVGRDGAIHVERLVLLGANEELHGYGDAAPYHDKKELQVPYFGGGKPWGRSVGIGMLVMELDVVKEMPQPNQKEPKPGCHMPYQSAHMP